MPNWCNNQLRITGTKKELTAIQEFLRGAYPKYSDDPREEEAEISDLCFNNILPVPEQVLKNGYSEVQDYTGGNLKKTAPKEGLMGYNWQVQNWGTKWAVTEVQMERQPAAGRLGEVVYTFDTAWSPMGENLVQKISEKFPKSEVTLIYDEPGNCFVGKYVYKAGDCIERDDIEGDGYRDAVIDIWGYDPYEDDEEENAQYEEIK